jgi:hypothetical protein
MYYILIIFLLSYTYSLFIFNNYKYNILYKSNFSEFFSHFMNIFIEYFCKSFIIIYDNNNENILFKYNKNVNNITITNNYTHNNIKFNKLYESHKLNLLFNYINSYIHINNLTLLIFSPHGALTLYALLSSYLSKKIVNNNGNFAVAKVLGYIPFINNIITLNSGIDISYLKYIFEKKERNIGLYIGGTKEQLYGTEEGQLFYSKKYKIFEYAITNGYDIIPSYTFGENDIIKRDYPNKLQKFLLKNYRIGMPNVKSIGKINLLCVYGKTIKTHKQMTPEDLFNIYKQEIIRIFDKYKLLYNENLLNNKVEFIEFNELNYKLQSKL